MSRNYKTANGTELPLLNLRGKEYLEVKYRLVWFREDHPDWSIETELLSVTDVSAYAKATIRDEKGRIIATSHKFETIQGFPDFLEKAETGAIGRALALVGYGTQFCADELDDGKPVSAEGGERPQAARPAQSYQAQPIGIPAEPGDYTIGFGRKYKGKKLKEIPRAEIESYIKWLENGDVQAGTPLSGQVNLLKEAYSRLYSAPAEQVQQ